MSILDDKILEINKNVAASTKDYIIDYSFLKDRVTFSDSEKILLLHKKINNLLETNSEDFFLYNVFIVQISVRTIIIKIFDPSITRSIISYCKEIQIQLTIKSNKASLVDELEISSEDFDEYLQ